jgi:hypothetical protein
MRYVGLLLADDFALLVNVGEDGEIGFIPGFKEGLRGYSEECFSGPFGQPMKLSMFAEGRIVDDVFSELFHFRVEHQHDLQSFLQIVGKIDQSILLVDCNVVFDQIVLKQIDQFLQICLAIGWLDEGCLQQNVEFFFLNDFGQLKMLDE